MSWFILAQEHNLRTPQNLFSTDVEILQKWTTCISMWAYSRRQCMAVAMATTSSNTIPLTRQLMALMATLVTYSVRVLLRTSHISMCRAVRHSISPKHYSVSGYGWMIKVTIISSCGFVMLDMHDDVDISPQFVAALKCERKSLCYKWLHDIHCAITRVARTQILLMMLNI